MRDHPLLVPISEVEFQLTLGESDVLALIRAGELTAVKVRGEVRVIFESVEAFARRAKKRDRVTLGERNQEETAR